MKVIELGRELVQSLDDMLPAMTEKGFRRKVLRREMSATEPTSLVVQPVLRSRLHGGHPPSFYMYSTEEINLQSVHIAPGRRDIIFEKIIFRSRDNESLLAAVSEKHKQYLNLRLSSHANFVKQKVPEIKINLIEEVHIVK